MKGKRISKKQKRVKATNRKTAARVSRHLVMGDQHDNDREAAARIRAFPVVPKLEQAPFPHERKVGFVGHFINGEFCVQGPANFEKMNVACKANAWYWRHDPRGNREPRLKISGIVETNVAISAGLAHVLADMAKEEKFDDVRRLTLCAGKAGMEEFERRSGYWAAYMALHPDSEGTLSAHFGLWPVDRKERKLIGRSATGKKGRRGLRTLGDAFMSVLRHHFAIGLPANLVWRPLENLKERDPDDWAVGLVMDRVLREEISKLPNGQKLLQQADEYQKAAARDWLARYEAGAAGLAKLKTERDAAFKAADRRKTAAERLFRRKDRGLEKEKAVLCEQSSADQEQIRSLSAKLVTMTDAAQSVFQEFKAVRSIIQPSPGEPLEDAAKRVVRELQESIDSERGLRHLVALLLQAILAMGTQAATLLDGTVRTALKNLGRAMKVDLGVVLDQQKRPGDQSSPKIITNTTDSSGLPSILGTHIVQETGTDQKM
jgi:hypothetical protein